MALRKTNTLVESYQFISMHDTAVDSESEEFGEKWKQYLDGVAEPPLKPGETPVIFTLRHLREREKERVLDQIAKDGQRAGMVAACALALRGAQNWDGSAEKKFETEVDDSWFYPIEVVKADELDLLPHEVMEEIGLRVWMADFPRPN